MSATGQSLQIAFITLLGGAAAWPLAARAQQSSMPVVGWLNSETPDGGYGLMAAAVRQGLSEMGFVEGHNVAIEYRWAQGHSDRLPMLAGELVRAGAAVIAAAGTASTLAAKAATTSTPIVFSVATDPVAMGLVASLNRPGGNLTGVANLGVELGPKQLQLLHELVPAATIMAVLVNPDFPVAESQAQELHAAARKLGLEFHILHASSERDLDIIFVKMVLRVGALAITADPFFLSRREQILTLATRHSLPAMSPWREAAAAGGLVSYGTSASDGYRQVGQYAGRILKGEKPADLPVQQATKFALVINLKTAKALGIEVPLSMLMRVDEVIE
jgi:putative tryptophan/tyrosine transport system substrate-binding protein